MGPFERQFASQATIFNQNSLTLVYCCASHYDFVFSFPNSPFLSSMGSWARLCHFTTFVNNPSERSERLVLYYSYKIEGLVSKLLEF